MRTLTLLVVVVAAIAAPAAAADTPKTDGSTKTVKQVRLKAESVIRFAFWRWVGPTV